MFVSSQRGRLSLVRQDTHMAQTADLARRWTAESFAAPDARERLGQAMAIHDNGWVPLDDEVRYDPDAQGPLNFLAVDLREHISLYRDAYEEAIAEDPATGLLVGMHWIGLYTMRFGLEPDGPYETDGPEEDRLRDEIVADVERSWVPLKDRLWKPVQPRSIFEDQLWRQYELFQYIDRLSIIMATRDLDEEGEWSVGRVRLRGGAWTEPLVRAAGDGTLSIDPFPFETEFTTSLERRLIPDRAYTSADDLHETVAATAPHAVDVRIHAR